MTDCSLMRAYGLSEENTRKARLSSIWMAVVGPDGSGKGGVVANLQFLFRDILDSKTNYAFFRYPGGLPELEYIRQRYTSGNPEDYSAEEESYMFAINRFHLYEKGIRRCLDNHAWVISDRWRQCAEAYQGRGRNMGPQRIAEINLEVCGNIPDPDFTFVLDVDPKVSYERACQHMEVMGTLNRRFEKFGEELQHAVMESYRDQAKRDSRLIMVDAHGDENQTVGNLMAGLNTLFDEGRIVQNPVLETTSPSSQSRVPHDILIRARPESPFLRP